MCSDGRRWPSAPLSRDQNSFQVTTSGPPSSKVRFAASGFSTAAAKYAATSSIQIGWIRCVPGPTIGVTGASFACRRNCCSAPPSRPKTKLGRKITCSSPDACDGLLHLPLRAVVRDELLRLLVRPERGHEHEATDALLLRGGDQVARALLITRSKSSRLAADDRDEVDDRVRTLHGARRRLAAPSCPLTTPRSPGSELLARPARRYEHAHGCARRRASARTIAGRRNPCRP